MIIDSLAMIAGDTSRSRTYIQTLIKSDILPGYVLVMRTDSGESKPGQLRRSNGMPEVPKKELRIWQNICVDLHEPIIASLVKAGIQHDVVSCGDINDPEIVAMIAGRPEQTFIYSGFGGTLLRKPVLQAGKDFLHVHGGYLPDYKGSTTNYFSLINENSIGASSIFLAEQIDCGPLLMRKKFASPKDRLDIDHFADNAARASVLIDTLKHFSETGNWPRVLADQNSGETYYIIHPVLKHIAILAGDS